MIISMAPDEDISFDSHFLSAPSSPHRLSVESAVAFYSVPPSPAAHGPDLTSGSSSSPSSSSCDPNEFEFAAVLHDGFVSPTHSGPPAQWTSSKRQRCRGGGESLPSMAFADELFCGGKVVTLKPPPGSPAADGSRSPRAPFSPRSPFSRRSLWNDDFDPFMAALENVREEAGAGGDKNQRRARSASPCRAGVDSTVHFEPVSPKLPLDRPGSPRSVLEPNKDASGPFQAHTKLDGPRGLRIMRFLMKSKSMATEEQEAKKLKKKRNFLRRLSISGIGGTVNTNNKKPSPPPATASSRAVTRVTALQYRPRLLLCIGYGRRSFRYVK